MDQFYYDDFNVMKSDENGHWVRVEELNKMIECGAITIDKEKIEKYNELTRLNK